MDAFSDPLEWRGPDVMLAGVPPYPMAQDDIHNSRAASSARVPELVVDRGGGGSGGDLSSIYQTALQYETGSGLVKECDRLFAKSSLPTIYNFGNDDRQVLGDLPAPSILSGTAAALSGCSLELQHGDGVDDRDGLLHHYGYHGSALHVIMAAAAAQEDVTGLVSSLGSCSSSPGAQISDQVELLGERVSDPSVFEESSYYYGVQLFGSSTSYSVGATDMLLPAADGSPTRDAVQTHALYPYLVSAHVDCCKIGAEPAEVKSMEDAHLTYQNFLPKKNSTHSTDTSHELDSVMAWYLRLLVDLKGKIEEPFFTEMEWCNEMLEKVKLLSPRSSSPTQMSGCTGDCPSTAGVRDGYAYLPGETMQQSYGISFDKKNVMTEHMKQGKVLKEWLRSKHDRSEIFSLRGQCKKKRKQGKHPPTARECLLDWFNCHGDWPYPSEEEKLMLVEQTKLEARQINNWFINQRKRHWDNTVKEEIAEHELKTYGRQIGNGEKVVTDTFYVPLDISPSLLTMGASFDPPLLPKLSPMSHL